MAIPIADSEWLTSPGEMLVQLIGSMFYRPASIISIWSLVSALLFAGLWLGIRHKKLWSPARAARTLLPDGYLTKASARADWFLLFANHTFIPAMIAFAILAASVISEPVTAALLSFSGATLFPEMPIWASRAATTLGLFIAYEFGYFLDHYLSHRIPFLWHFHKVHHSATSLSPLTNFRVHPIDSLVFANIVALTMGVTGGVCKWAFGANASPFAFDGVNMLMLVFVYSLLHLQHTHLWITFKGLWGKVLMSPAAHQLHHSLNPADFNCNYGNALAIWDRLFGCYNTPPEKSPGLRFGVEGLGYNPHGFYGLIIGPCIDAVRPAFRPEPAPADHVHADATLQTAAP